MRTPQMSGHQGGGEGANDTFKPQGPRQDPSLANETRRESGSYNPAQSS